jgi:hypothetical protein
MKNLWYFFKTKKLCDLWKMYGNTLHGKRKNFTIKVEGLNQGNSLRSLRKGDSQFWASNRETYDFSFPDRVPPVRAAEIVWSA